MDLSRRKANRLPDYDYSRPGCYFITICTQGRRRLLWEREPSGSSVGAACGRPPLSRLGFVVEREIARLHHTYPVLTVEKYVIMSNHVHLLLRISQTGDGRPQAAPTIAQAINQFKGAAAKAAGHPIWQKGYHDHVVRNDADYLRIWSYIDTNPAKWREDCYFTETEE